MCITGMEGWVKQEERELEEKEEKEEKERSGWRERRGVVIVSCLFISSFFF